MKIAIIGASGFVGRHLVAHLLDHRVEAVAIDRRASGVATGALQRVVAEEADDRDRVAAMAGVDAVVHLAARVHRRDDAAVEEYLRVNRDLALRWASAARAAGVRRFVYVSSVKAVAELSDLPLDESAPARPQDPYGRSKLAAEAALASDPALAPLERVIVRPPLVYGAGVGANFLQLMRVASLRCPLPFSGAIAPRSMISAVNLADALLACALAPQANGRTYFVADSEDLTVAGLLASLRRLEGRSPGLFFVAPLLLRRLAAAIGRGDAAARLFDSLQLDCSRIRGELGWSPPQATMTGLADTLAWYHQARR